MTIFHSDFWWMWVPISIVCLIGMVWLGRKSSWYCLFWIPLVALSLVFAMAVLQSCGMGRHDGPSALVGFYVVLPMVLASSMGIAGLFLLVLARPRDEAWSMNGIVGGVLIAWFGVGVSTQQELETLSVTVLDGEGRPCAGVVVDLLMSDLVTKTNTQSKVTDGRGHVTFQVRPFLDVQLQCSKPGGFESRSTFGNLRFGGTRSWNHQWSNRLSPSVRASCCFLDDVDSSATTVYLQSGVGKAMPAVSRRLEEVVAVSRSHEQGKELVASMRCPEALGLLDSIENLWRDDPAMEDAVSSCLIGLAEMVGWVWRANGDDPDSTAVFAGESIKGHAQRLLDAAMPMLGAESSSAQVYWELKPIARERLQDLVEAYPNATDRGKDLIQMALGKIKPEFGEVSSLLPVMQVEQALRLMSEIDQYGNSEEFEEARSWVEQARLNGGELQAHRYWFEYLGHRFARPQDYKIRIGD